MGNGGKGMKVAIGTLNRTKIAAVQTVFSNEAYEFVFNQVPSGVSNQPFSDEETLQGAINRAKNALIKENADIGIGLEGGVVVEPNQTMWLCNWGALVDRAGIVVVAGGARIPLPPEVANELMNGRELAEVMDEYTGKRNIRTNEGAIGVFTSGFVNRTDMYVHIVQLLAGQYEFVRKDGNGNENN
jgi:inosine/xanthosine triphosphatase